MEPTLKFSKNVFCPVCQHKLAKLRDENGVRQVHHRHKRSEVFAERLTVRCLGCDRLFDISAESGLEL